MPPNLANDVCQICSSPLAPPPIFPRSGNSLFAVEHGKYFFHWLFIWIKKWDTENFEPKQTAAKFSANIIGCCSICLWEFFSCGSSWAPTPTGLCENSCLRGFNLRVFLKRCLAKWENICRVPRQITNFRCAEISEGGGGEKPDFLRSENVALCLFTSKAMAALRWSSPPKRSKNKFMAVLRWFLPRENRCIIWRASEA